MARGAAQQGGEDGEKQRERAADVMNNTFSMLVITGVILCMVVLLIKKPVLYLFGASDATYPYADSYLSVYMLGSVFMMVSLGMNGFINAQGFANRGMLTVVIGAVVNIALDPLLIFVFDMGVQGAALATVLSQLVSAVWVVRFLLGKRTLFRLEVKAHAPAGKAHRQDHLAWHFGLYHGLYVERCAGGVQRDAFATRRRPVRRGHDGHQLHSRSDIYAGKRCDICRGAGGQLQLRRTEI